jgi:hypothetical protein
VIRLANKNGVAIRIAVCRVVADGLHRILLANFDHQVGVQICRLVFCTRLGRQPSNFELVIRCTTTNALVRSSCNVWIVPLRSPPAFTPLNVPREAVNRPLRKSSPVTSTDSSHARDGSFSEFTSENFLHNAELRSRTLAVMHGLQLSHLCDKHGNFQTRNPLHSI